MTEKHKYPNLFLVGAQKCGTSSLAAWLSQHPEICLTIPKEPCIFSKEERYLTEDPYAASKNASSLMHAKFFLDASTSYLYEDYVPERIFEKVGNEARFLIIIRDPLIRSVSAYYHCAKRSHDKRNFAEIFQHHHAYAEKDNFFALLEARGVLDLRKASVRYDDKYWQFRYVTNSRYYDHIKRYTDVCGKDRVKIVTLESFTTNPVDQMHSITDFIRADRFQELPNFSIKSNTTKVPRSIFKKYNSVTRPILSLLNKIAYRSGVPSHFFF